MEKYFSARGNTEKERERERLRARARPSSLERMREKFPREGKSRSRSNINRAFRRINWQRPFYSSRPTGICPRSRYTNTLPLLPPLLSFLSFFPRLVRAETTNPVQSLHKEAFFRYLELSIEQSQLASTIYKNIRAKLNSGGF